jgi:hypothetical protein
MAANSGTKGETLRAADISPPLWEVSVAARAVGLGRVTVNKDKRLPGKISKRLSEPSTTLEP